tara:strand:+ start:1519 stop:1755 length:237 start_codon:yes stop_codon:yes gene_type:complete
MAKTRSDKQLEALKDKYDPSYSPELDKILDERRGTINNPLFLSKFNSVTQEEIDAGKYSKKDLQLINKMRSMRTRKMK